DAASRSRALDRVVVSTDSSEIADVARGLGAEVLERPAELAPDDTPMTEVVLHALRELSDCEFVVVLQPTSPLRQPEHIDAAVEQLRTTGADTVVSVTRVPHRYMPESLMRLDDG